LVRVAGEEEWARILSAFLRKNAKDLEIHMTQMIRTREEVTKILDDFLSSRGGAWDWDDSLSFSLDDQELETIRNRGAKLDSESPATEKDHFCGSQGLAIIRG
jgi:hypothetical protein